MHIYSFNDLKFTLKHLKGSYMFRSYDHPQGAFISMLFFVYDTSKQYNRIFISKYFPTNFKLYIRNTKLYKNIKVS